MIVLICGDREWDDGPSVQAPIFALCTKLYPQLGPVVIREGCARGADARAEACARSYAFTVQHYPAAWDVHGNAAGPIRNTQMLKGDKDGFVPPDITFGFHDYIVNSKGTFDMLKRSAAAGIPTFLVTHKDAPDPNTGERA